MPFVERDDGACLHWDGSGEGPGLLMAHSYVQHPGVLQGLVHELRRGHRMISYDARGAGQSSRRGPYDMATDVADLIAVVEAAAPIVAVVANGDSTNRAIHAAAERPDLIPYVVSLETVPLARGQAAGTESLLSSGQVLEALVAMMRADYRSGVIAAVERGNPGMSQEELRDRVDRTVAYIDHDAALGRLEAWIQDEPGDDPCTLGSRLVVAYHGAGGWFPADLTERGSELLPAAQFVKLEQGAITRPDLSAAVVRTVTGAAAPTP